jgi:hypothetical protein
MFTKSAPETIIEFGGRGTRTADPFIQHVVVQADEVVRGTRPERKAHRSEAVA